MATSPDPLSQHVVEQNILDLAAELSQATSDLYSAARNGYLQRRRLVVQRAAGARRDEWQWAFGPARRPDRAFAASVPVHEDPA